MAKLDAKDIDLILALSRAYSLSAAARQLNITTAAVCQRLDKIEEKLGATLIRRHGQIEFTQPGHAVMQHCMAVRRSEEIMDQAIEKLNRPGIYIVAPEHILVADFPEAINALTNEWPALHITCESGGADNAERLVETGAADFAIITARSNNPALRVMPYRQESICIHVCAGHPLAERKAVSIIEAIQYPLIIGPEDSFETRTIFRVANDCGIQLDIPMICDSYSVQTECATLTNIGLAIAPESAAKPANGGAVLRITEEWAKVQLYFCTREADGSSDESIFLMKWLANAAKLKNA